MAVEMIVEYTGELRCRAEHGPSGSVLETDAPRDNEGRGELFSPTDLVGAALMTCAMTTMAIKGRKEGIDFTRAAGRVVKEMTSQGPRKIARLTLEIVMPAGLPPAHRTRLEEIARSCPVALSLAETVEVPMTFSYPGA
ncbi:MAG: OsmC family protein [Deltaproteobacteria bacterium]|nr:OsmC family protein [Deltaproteobacteria bacterium]